MEPLKPGSNANAEGVRGDSQDPSGLPVPGNPAGSGSILGSLTAKTSKTPGETAGEGRPTRGRLATDSLSMPPVPAPAAQTPPESTLLSYEPKREGTSARAASAEAGAGVDEREQRRLRREA